MRALLLILVTPLLLCAQSGFAPLRLDDGIAQNYFYPTLSVGAEHQLHCTWSFFTDSLTGAFGQQLTAGGERVGAYIPHDVMAPEGYLCPPEVILTRTFAGGPLELINHS